MSQAKKPKLTYKEAKLVKGIAEGKTRIDAYIAAYDTKGHIPTVKSAASRTANKPHIQEAIEAAMVKLNLTPERALQPIDDALKDDDVKTRLMGSDRVLRLMQPREGSDININFNKVTLSDKDEFGI